MEKVLLDRVVEEITSILPLALYLTSSDLTYCALEIIKLHCFKHSFPPTTMRYCQTQRSKVWMDWCMCTPMFSIPKADKTIYISCPTHSWDVKADSTILSHMPYRHNITCKLFAPLVRQDCGWRELSSYMEVCASSWLQETAVELVGWGMTLYCRPDSDQLQIPLQDSSVCFLTLTAWEETKTPTAY